MASLYNNKFYHRDLSWLRFNHRVLQEAKDLRNPLYERLKFLAIFSSNLDEFFRVRVSDIRQIKHLEKPLRKRLITKPNRVLREIKKQVDILQKEFGNIFENLLIPALSEEGIHLVGYEKYNEHQKTIATKYYEKNLQPKIKLHFYDKGTKNQAFVKNETLYLASEVDGDRFCLLEIPSSEPRFFVFPSEEKENCYVSFIDDIFKYNLLKDLSKFGNVAFYSLKVTRDAELYIEDEFSGNLMEKIKAALPSREEGQATRILLDSSMPESFQEILKKALDVSNIDLVLGGRYHNFKDFMDFPNPTDKDLDNPKLPPLPHPVLKDRNSIMEAMEENDQLLHFPYQSFDPIIRFVKEAASDPLVTTIKMTIYRTALDSALNKALTTAAKNGKEVLVFMEVKARFDEENNLKWGDIFRQHGVKVIYSYPDIKVHSKILYIEKDVEGHIKRYAYIATGNFNENTATLYTDFGLLTTHPKITKELNRVFSVLEGKMIIPKTKKLLVSPFSMRNRFIEMIDREIALAERGKRAWLILKMNSLEDKEMIKKLYQASNAGVHIRLLIRGICCLVPGVEGQSENIYITSIVDRFLEHGRVYIFGNSGNPEVYIGSADWMTRNLSHRIEVVVPVLDEQHKQTIMDVVQFELADNVKARIIDPEQKNEYVINDQPRLRSQMEIYNYFQKNT